MGNITDFITRWKASGGSEQANSQLFLTELCDALDLPRPEPAKPINEENSYSFERKIYIPCGNNADELKRLDLYRKGCFVLESKQGQNKTALPTLPGMTSSAAVKRGSRPWEDTMQRAKRQAENYIRCLPAIEGRPPFLIVVDVGFCFDIYT
ncbi:DNA methylase, partial [Desulfovibrio sp. OttesenSCG-928-F20]|nr:DNA methylase [Desulfovibrio sp. OttesenSCG-928-F20]